MQSESQSSFERSMHKEVFDLIIVKDPTNIDMKRRTSDDYAQNQLSVQAKIACVPKCPNTSRTFRLKTQKLLFEPITICFVYFAGSK